MQEESAPPAFFKILKSLSVAIRIVGYHRFGNTGCVGWWAFICKSISAYGTRYIRYANEGERTRDHSSHCQKCADFWEKQRLGLSIFTKIKNSEKISKNLLTNADCGYIITIG